MVAAGLGIDPCAGTATKDSKLQDGKKSQERSGHQGFKAMSREGCKLVPVPRDSILQPCAGLTWRALCCWSMLAAIPAAVPMSLGRCLCPGCSRSERAPDYCTFAPCASAPPT